MTMAVPVPSIVTRSLAGLGYTAKVPEPVEGPSFSPTPSTSMYSDRLVNETSSLSRPSWNTNPNTACPLLNVSMGKLTSSALGST